MSSSAPCDDADRHRAEVQDEVDQRRHEARPRYAGHTVKYRSELLFHRAERRRPWHAFDGGSWLPVPRRPSTCQVSARYRPGRRETALSASAASARRGGGFGHQQLPKIQSACREPLANAHRPPTGTAVNRLAVPLGLNAPAADHVRTVGIDLVERVAGGERACRCAPAPSITVQPVAPSALASSSSTASAR